LFSTIVFFSTIVLDMSWPEMLRVCTPRPDPRSWPPPRLSHHAAAVLHVAGRHGLQLPTSSFLVRRRFRPLHCLSWSGTRQSPPPGTP
jgi:hypothetical protein